MRKVTLFGLAASLMVTGLASVSQTQTPAPAVELKVGDIAPDWSLAGSDGKTHKLSELGKATVMAWFPKAFTGG